MLKRWRARKELERADRFVFETKTVNHYRAMGSLDSLTDKQLAGIPEWVILVLEQEKFHAQLTDNPLPWLRTPGQVQKGQPS